MDYSIKQISEKTHLSNHTLRYYEKEGLLAPIKRNDSGFRRFSQDDLDWLGLICCLKSTGMSIKQIKEFVKLSIEGNETLQKRLDILQIHKASVKQEISNMEKNLLKVNEKIACFTEQFNEYNNR